ncbi:MAG: hypothetical protein ACKD6M_06300 [Candidatus Bathyarchaeota archaeon]
MKVGEKFKPHPNLKKVYGVYLLLVTIPVVIATVLPVLVVFTFEPQIWSMVWPFTFIPLAVVFAIFGFIAYWIPKYYDSIYFTLEKGEVIVEREGYGGK